MDGADAFHAGVCNNKHIILPFLDDSGCHQTDDISSTGTCTQGHRWCLIYAPIEAHSDQQAWQNRSSLPTRVACPIEHGALIHRTEGKMPAKAVA